MSILRNMRDAFPLRSAFLFFLFLVIVTGGGTHIWSQSLIVITSGFILLISPLSGRLQKNLFLISIIAFGIVGLIGFMPLPEALQPVWRRELANNFNLNLGPLVSAQPLVSLEALVLFWSGLVILLVFVSIPLDHKERKNSLWAFSWMCVLIAMGMIVANLLGLKNPLAPWVHNFSFFPNKNQTATVLAMGGVVAFGLGFEALKRKRLRGVFSSIGATITLFAGLIFCLSRAGILLYLIGCIVWLVSSLFISSAKSRRSSIIGLSFILLGVSAFVFFGGNTFDRLDRLFASESESRFFDFRWSIYEDTMNLVQDHWVSGVGLGNFGEVFPQYRYASINDSGIIHPESDLLWLIAETGILAMVPILLIIGLVLNSAFRFRGLRAGRYHRIAAAALIVFILNALIDVPAHRLGTALCAIFLVGLIMPGRSHGADVNDPWKIRMGGGAILVLFGFSWLCAFLFQLPLHSSVVDQKSQIDINLARLNGEPADAFKSTNQAVFWMPLGTEHYYNRALLNLYFSNDKRAALSDFRISRYLEPNHSERPYREGLAWMPFDTTRTLVAWRETIHRANDSQKLYLFRSMLNSSRHYPELREGLRSLSLLDSNLRFEYLIGSDPDEFVLDFERNHFSVSPWSEFTWKQWHELILRWVSHGGAEKFIKWFTTPGHTDLDFLNREILARAYSELGDYSSACKVLLKHLIQPDFPSLIAPFKRPRLDAEFLQSGGDLVLGSVLLELQVNGGDYTHALRTCNKLMKNELVPNYVIYWCARLLTHQHEYEKAWKIWEQYLDVKPHVLRTPGS